jgi:hypothetical protein
VETEAPDFYALALSTRCAADLGRALGCDSCVEIFDYPAFFDVLTQRLVVEVGVTSFLLTPCIYASRRRHHRTAAPGHPALIKDRRYEGQAEVRALWEPASRPIHPRIVTCPELANYCRAVEPP